MTDEAEVTNTEAPAAATVDYEVEARKYGWVPKEEFRDDESKWRPAKEFVERGQEILGFVRKELNKTKEQLAAERAEFENFRKEADEFKKYREKAEENAYKRALAELKDQKKKAIELGDGDAVVEIDDEIDKIKTEKQAAKAAPTETVDLVKVQNQRILNSWIADGNEIFAKDAEVMQLANDYADVVRLDPKTKHLVGIEYLDAVAEKVREAAPHKFGNPARTKPSAVGASGDASRTVTGKKKSYADLPEDAKKACDKFVKNGWLTKEKYVEDYFQGE